MSVQSLMCAISGEIGSASGGGEGISRLPALQGMPKREIIRSTHRSTLHVDWSTDGPYLSTVHNFRQAKDENEDMKS